MTVMRKIDSRLHASWLITLRMLLCTLSCCVWNYICPPHRIENFHPITHLLPVNDQFKCKSGYGGVKFRFAKHTMFLVLMPLITFQEMREPNTYHTLECFLGDLNNILHNLSYVIMTSISPNITIGHFKHIDFT